MKTILATVMQLTLFSLASVAQDTVPSEKACQSSSRAWAGKGDAESLPVTELITRGQFLQRYVHAYPHSPLIRAWELALGTYGLAYGGRATSFIVRHNLRDQFLKEDAAGIGREGALK